MPHTPFFYLCALLAIVIAIAAAPAATADESYLAGNLNYADIDEQRGIEGSGTGATFLYGFDVAEHWFLEARLTGLVLERGDEGGTDFYQQDLGVDAVYRFGSRDGWQPFALLGLSYIRNDVETKALDDTGGGAHAGIGFVSAPLGAMGMRFRMEVRHVEDDYLDGMQDLRIGIGLEIPLGSRPARTSTAFRGDDTTRGVPGNDSDDDGVDDANDRCPGSLAYVKHDASGCMLPNQTIRMYEVTFNNGTAILTAAARAELGALVIALRAQPGLHVRVDGHTDSLGDSAANRALSLERAEAVATHLALQGVATQRVSVKGFGESRPVESNSTAAGRERNRRIEIVLLEPPRH